MSYFSALMVMMMMNYFCGMSEWQKELNIFSATTIFRGTQHSETPTRCWMNFCSSDSHSTTAPLKKCPSFQYSGTSLDSFCFFFWRGGRDKFELTEMEFQWKHKMENRSYRNRLAFSEARRKHFLWMNLSFQNRCL